MPLPLLIVVPMAVAGGAAVVGLIFQELADKYENKSYKEAAKKHEEYLEGQAKILLERIDKTKDSIGSLSKLNKEVKQTVADSSNQTKESATQLKEASLNLKNTVTDLSNIVKIGEELSSLTSQNTWHLNSQMKEVVLQYNSLIELFKSKGHELQQLQESIELLNNSLNEQIQLDEKLQKNIQELIAENEALKQENAKYKAREPEIARLASQMRFFKEAASQNSVSATDFLPTPRN